MDVFPVSVYIYTANVSAGFSRLNYEVAPGNVTGLIILSHFSHNV